MNIQDVKRDKERRKTCPVNLRITKTISDWMRKENISPQKIFDLAISKLMENKN